MEKEEYLFKVVVVGDWSVGKSSLLYRYKHDDFPLNLMMTIGCDFMKKIEKVDECAVCLQVWDHSSSERYCRIPKIFYRNTSTILLSYDITSKVSFMNLEYWINDLENIIDPNVTIVLVGNKCDLNEKRAVTYEEGKKFAEEYNLLFYETSAKDNINVHSMFNELASYLKSKVDMGKIPQNMNTKASIVKLHDSNLNIHSDGCSDKVGCII